MAGKVCKSVNINIIQVLEIIVLFLDFKKLINVPIWVSLVYYEK
jgi:hypothetical protein